MPRLYKRGDKVTCNGNPEGIVQDAYEWDRYIVRLFSGLRHVGDVVVSGDDLDLENPPAYHYCRGGAGFILYRSADRQAIWETATMAAMVEYLKANDIRSIEYRQTSIAVFR